MKLALIGDGGHAREVMSQMGLSKMTRFVDDKYWKDSNPDVRPLSEFNVDEYSIMVAIGSSIDRMDIVRKLPEETEFFSFIHPTAQIMSDDIEIGEGSFIGANCILTCNIKIGEHAILNRAVQIGHDCVIDDFFSAMPGAIVSGNVCINKRVYIGTNSSIKEKTVICSNTTIGAQSFVSCNISESGVYGGVPAKLLY